MSNSETVRDVCADQLELPTIERNQDWQVACLMFRDELHRMKREMAAKDAEIARLKEYHCEYSLPNHGCIAEDKHFHKTVELERKVELLERALKPVMECAVCKVDGTAVADGEICTSSDYGVCDYEGNQLDWHDVAECLDSVREAQRIMKEGGAK